MNRLRELESRVERLEDELRWLRRALEANDERAGTTAVGPCPNCETGVLTARGGELRCSACEFSKFL
ncbi:hypothetical protein M0R89_18680 (plasmid) [Halorussus limi]|uniref:Uncharacterized protein n=1 Tax=Halorussus limi TaxID=2938695 RepID=A0A8U0I086_9EURY|nr:hypothetical protein [Halorussus limi]UPV76559.1 hypothetical protein M0R89_18680 [Halorussus limi]